ncbi:hypothetical protein ACHAWO_000440 [Cyclotella atomus]|uniref:RING-type E3 ubiquitin transferase n=1 Tax=Cyclotella atomus TaxID=382360 RepID=A0ABD3PUE1_9STRA
MILAWRSEGDPLQCIALLMFLIQFLMDLELIQRIINAELGTGFGIGRLLLMECLVLGMAVFVRCFFSDHPGNIDGVNNNGGAMRNSGDGTADNPVNADAQDDNRNTNNNTGEFNSLMGTIRRTLPNISPHHLLVSLFILPIFMVIPIFINLGTSGMVASSSGTIAQIVLAIVEHAFLASSISYVAYIKKYTGGVIADLIRKVPVEEYVSEQKIRNGECSTSKMKRMLLHRGAADEADRCLEQQDLVDEICRVRIYEKECTICSEEYVEGDALRVLPCRHEYHLHCFDRWVYTFETDARANAELSCPLCRYKLS